MSSNQSPEELFRKKQGYLLSKARRMSKFSQSDAAKYVGLSQDTISKMEKGKQPVTSYRLLEFARLYNKPVNFFYMVNVEDIKSTKH